MYEAEEDNTPAGQPGSMLSGPATSRLGWFDDTQHFRYAISARGVLLHLLATPGLARRAKILAGLCSADQRVPLRDDILLSVRSCLDPNSPLHVPVTVTCPPRSVCTPRLSSPLSRFLSSANPRSFDWTGL